MIIEIKIPSPGESISEVEIANWFVENGDTVAKDQEIGEVESEKATLPLIAEEEGKIEILAESGQTVEVGSIVCKIDTSVKHLAEKSNTELTEADEADENKPAEKEEKGVVKEESASKKKAEKKERTDIKTTPLAKKMMQESGLEVDDIISGLKRISSNDVQAVVNSLYQPGNHTREISREQERKALSQLRKKISERLVAVKNETAMLTTFNEVDMSAVIHIRKQYQDQFIEKHGVKLGFMSFFTKAVTLALQQYPNVNSFLDKEEIVTPDYCDIGIAVQTDKGLMVPVIRNVETLSLADIEKNIIDLAGKARKNRISMDELSGGTFTITNGGIFGSMLSTPILNPPQSGILGMHNIQDRPVAVNGEVVIRPMMYIALSYDHRIIDGRDSVGFLKTVKEYIENPVKMIFGDQLPESVLLGI